MFSSCFRAEIIPLPSSLDKIICLFAKIEAKETLEKFALPDELSAAIQLANPRKCEFLSGRILARHALAKINVPGNVGSDNESLPLFPDGSIGSISHSKNVIAVAVSKSRDYKTIGIDIEHIGRIKDNVLNKIATPKEKTALESLPEKQSHIQKALLFCAKEAFFKAQFPHTRFYPHWQDIGLDFTSDGNINIDWVKHPSPAYPLLGNAVSCYRVLGDIVFSVFAS